MGNRDSFLGVKRPGHEADHSPLSSAEVKECVDLYLHSPIRFMTWCLVKHKDNFTSLDSFVLVKRPVADCCEHYNKLWIP
jgi:hypothetical protein